MYDYVGTAKNIIDDMFFDKKNYFFSIFSTDYDYKEFINYSLKVLSSISISTEELEKLDLDDSVMLLNENLFNFYRFIFKEMFKSPQDLFDELKIIQFLRYISYLNKGVISVAKNKYARKKLLGEGKDSLILLPNVPIDYIIREKITFDLIKNAPQKESINAFIEEILTKNSSKALNEGTFNKLKNLLFNYLKSKGATPLDEQIDVIKSVIKHSFVSVEGVPGSSKTFTCAFSIILSAIYCSMAEGKKVYTSLITGHTYKSVEESFKKFLEIIKSQIITEFLKKVNKEKVCLYFYVSSSNLNEYKKYEKETDDNIDIIVDSYLPEFKENEYNFIFFFSPLAVLNTYKEEISKETLSYYNQAVKDSLISIKQGKYSKGLNNLKRIYADLSNISSNNTLNVEIDHIHIEEASQFSAVNLIILLNFITQNNNDKYKNFSERGKFTLSGDSKQLSPIYSYLTTGRNMLRIGSFYNLFTFFLNSKLLKKKLKISLRNPQYIIKLIKPIYGDITSINKDQNLTTNIITHKKDIYSILRRITTLGRISYEIITEKPFKNKLQDENPVELYISKLINNVFKETYSKNIFFLTPFKKQEILLLQDGIESGTVDKMQGKESEIVVYLTTAHEEEYLSKVIPFICIPNRINVALSRTTQTFFLVHSKNLEKELSSKYYYSKENDEFRLGYALQKGKLLPRSTSNNLLSEYNINLGIYILQTFIENTVNELSTFYIPIEIINGNLKLQDEINNVKPSKNNYVKLSLFNQTL